MEAFYKRMGDVLLPCEIEILKKEYDKPYYKGVRVNTLKCSVDKFLSVVPSVQSEDVTPFCKSGFYIDDKTQISGNHPLHHAGAVYFQEPSAMSAATLLDVQKGDFVLDLCAAPGGKSTQLASALAGEGLLWSNEIVHSRANILLSNMERCGVANAVVSSCDPETLCEKLSGFFDRVLVDAPCSGEGMFRRDEGAKKEWSAEHSDACAVRQLKILESAKKALKCGGIMVYSTCTFSKAENESVVENFLASNPDFELLESGESFGRVAEDGKSCRIFPMDGGEGHFAAKLRKKGDGEYRSVYQSAPLTPKAKIPSCVTQFIDETFKDTSRYSNLLLVGDKVYALPDGMPDVKGVGVIRAGVFVGEVRKNRFEPAHALYMSADVNNLVNVIMLEQDDVRVGKFLHGEEIDVEAEVKGYAAVAYCSVIMGFGKASGGKLKNKYPKGLRTL